MGKKLLIISLLRAINILVGACACVYISLFKIGNTLYMLFRNWLPTPLECGFPYAINYSFKNTVFNDYIVFYHTAITKFI